MVLSLTVCTKSATALCDHSRSTLTTRFGSYPMFSSPPSTLSASWVFVMLNCWCCFQFIVSDTFVAFQLQIIPKQLDMFDTLYGMRLELTRTIRGMLDWQKSNEKLQTCFFNFFNFFIFSIASNHTWTRFPEMTVITYQQLMYQHFLTVQQSFFPRWFCFLLPVACWM